MSTEADIVERLERFARVGAGVAVLIDAAEEIKQLRAEVEKLRAFCRTHIGSALGTPAFVATTCATPSEGQS